MFASNNLPPRLEPADQPEVRGTPAEAAWINDASARSSAAPSARPRARAPAPSSSSRAGRRAGAHCPPVPPAQDNPYRGAAACADVEVQIRRDHLLRRIARPLYRFVLRIPAAAVDAQQLKLWNISYSEGAAPCLSYTAAGRGRVPEGDVLPGGQVLVRPAPTPTSARRVRGSAHDTRAAAITAAAACGGDGAASDRRGAAAGRRRARGGRRAEEVAVDKRRQGVPLEDDDEKEDEGRSRRRAPPVKRRCRGSRRCPGSTRPRASRRRSGPSRSAPALRELLDTDETGRSSIAIEGDVRELNKSCDPPSPA